MPTYGRTLLSAHNILNTRVSADGAPKYKAGGVTIDLNSLPAAPGADVVLPDGSTVKANAGRYMRYGQILTRNNTLAVQTVTFGGTPSGGTYTLTYAGFTTAALAWNATAAQVAAALNALTPLAPNGVAASGGPGPTAIPVTFDARFGAAALMTATSSLTGTSPTVTVANTTAGVAAAGKYGPYDPAATDGRQNLIRGYCVILDETWLENPAGGSFGGLGGTETIGGVFEAGDVWFDRILQSGTATHSLALGPTTAEFEAAFPRISYYGDRH